MRRLHAIAAMLMLASGPRTAMAAEELPIIQTSDIKIGEITFLKLPGDPQAGYKWRLDKELSKGLNLFLVDQIGWLIAPEEKSMFFKNSECAECFGTGQGLWPGRPGL